MWKFAKELVELRSDVIVARSSPVVPNLIGQTRNIPILFVSISDPIGEGTGEQLLRCKLAWWVLRVPFT